MISKYLFTTCKRHNDCTLKAGFVLDDDPGYDSVTDRKAISEHLQKMALSNFGEVFCVTTEHLSGRLGVEL